MIKILHTADLHLGYRQYGFALREGDFYMAAQQVFKKAVELKVDAILIAGDLFDSTKPPATAVWIVSELVKYAKEHNIEVLGIDGNHDATEGNWMKVCGIKTIGGQVVTIQSADGVFIRIGGINSCRPTVFYETLANMRNTEKQAVQVVAIHQAVAELSDFPTQDFTALQMASAMKPLGVQYVAMGDIHTYRETVIGGVRFAYSGSTEVNAIDEPNEKSCSLIMYDGAKVTTGMVPLKTRPFLVCQLEAESDLDSLLTKTAGAEQPFIIGWYSSDKRDLGKRAETMLREAGCMYRIMPYAGDKITQRTATFERKGAMLQLKDAVTAYFEEGTDEYQLVFQLLGAPDNVKQIIEAYKKSKGL